MKKSFTYTVICCILFLSACRSDEKDILPGDVSLSGNASAPLGAVVKGRIRMKLTRETGNRFTIRETAGKLRSNAAGMDACLHEIGAKNMKRVFPDAGKYEERTRREGLHLWYDITFDESIPVTRAATAARDIPGVEIVEEIRKPKLQPFRISGIKGSTTGRAGNTQFNDPFLSSQWHYNNTGIFAGSLPGADINLFKAWEKETGKPGVIVAVVDGGIDVAHEDLRESMRVNEAELNGVPGVDDDGNGFIDDIYGYNFALNKGEITPEAHGTHVAGTVAACNNNGIGVCGVAGGNGETSGGSRLLSCQIFSGMSGANVEAAIKYGADNGAVISQNSWGFEYPGPSQIPASIREAIDYFIKYAGCDNNGNQLPDSPMKGGVVIFAAGNDDKDFKSYPSAYPPVVSVSAMAPDFKKTWYTNRGDWISVMAPGGDEFYADGMVASTLPGNEYGYMQGTSMACPHVSGIAALVVSKFGGAGFTNEELKRRITTAFRPMDIDAINPDYKGRLGKGYIDAEKALAVNENKKPGKVAAVSVKKDYITLELSWKAVADEDDGTATLYKLHYSGNQLDPGNYHTADAIEITGITYKPDDDIVYTLKDLPLNTQFYFALLAEDRWGLQSEPLFFSAKTEENFPPTLTRTGAENIRITGNETAEVKIRVEEPEQQEWTYKISGQQQGVSVIRQHDGVTFKIKAIAPPGKHSVKIEVSDIFNASASLEIPFEIYENHPPGLIKEFQKIFIPVTKSDYSINLSEYFSDKDGHEITYSVRPSDASVLGASLQGGKLTFNPLRLGVASLEITATDSQNAYKRTTVQVQIVKDELVYVIYPVPVSKVLNVRLSDAVQDAELSIYTSTGTKVYEKSISADTPEQRLIQLDLSKLSGGTYVLYADADGKTFRQLFIKL